MCSETGIAFLIVAIMFGLTGVLLLLLAAAVTLKELFK